MPPVVRTSQQARSIKTRERLLEAGARLFEERGYDGFTLADVAAKAQLAVGSIYQRIGNKDDLLLAVYDRQMSALAAEWETLYDLRELGNLEAPALVDRVVSALANIVLRHRAFLRVAISRSMVEPELQRRGSHHVQDLSRQFEAALLLRRDSWTHPDPDTAVDVCFRMVFSTIVRRATHGPTFESGRALADDTLIANLVAACLGLLTADVVSA